MNKFMLVIEDIDEDTVKIHACFDPKLKKEVDMDDLSEAHFTGLAICEMLRTEFENVTVNIVNGRH